MMELRPYQQKAVDNAVDMLCERGNSLIVAGTGAGKTIMMAAAIGKWYKGFVSRHGRKPHALVLVHRTEIHSQNKSKFSLVCPDIATSEITATKKSVKGNVHFGMVQTVVNLLPEFEKANSFFDLIVIDECHHAAASTYENIIEWNTIHNPQSAVLGVTATPNRGDKLPLIHLWDNYYQITSRFLIDSHYLIRPNFLDLSPVFTRDGETEKGHLGKYIKNDEAGRAAISKLCEDYLKHKEPGKTVIFAPSHEFCTLIYDALKEKGRKPAYLAIGIDDETRKNELEKFEKSDCDELINVDICTEGYDFPGLCNLVDFDTNGTHGQWVQKVGRVLRTAPGKTTCTVIDFGGNIDLYPDGVETGVNLEGAVKNKKGHRLCDDDFFVKPRKEREEKGGGDVVGQYDEIYTPYHPPRGFETVNDADFGIVFVACGTKMDCIVVKTDMLYTLYAGDKTWIGKRSVGEFDACMRDALALIDDEFEATGKPISKMQIKMLAPEYPTTALDWDGANCCICWKMWKKDIEGDICGSGRPDIQS